MLFRSLPLPLPLPLPPSSPSQLSLEGQKERLLREFESSPVRAAIQQRLYHYLNYNHHHLPMYAQPDII